MFKHAEDGVEEFAGWPILVHCRLQKIFAYDGDNLIEELNTNGSAAVEYTEGLGIDEPMEETASGTSDYYEADGLGAIAASYVYDSFGNIKSSTGTLTNPFRYTGRELDSETGLYYYRARYYDPSIGRFLSEDPIGLLSGTANLYDYVHNDPTNLVDPLGYCADKKHTAACIQRALQALFPGVRASVGRATREVGGHWNFGIQLQFPSQAAADAFAEVYAVSALNGVGPWARFGSGPALHLENIAGSSANGTYTGTAPIDLYNPNRSLIGGGGVGGFAGHVGVDGVVGHIVQALGSNIDPKNCPW